MMLHNIWNWIFFSFRKVKEDLQFKKPVHRLINIQLVKNNNKRKIHWEFTSLILAVTVFTEAAFIKLVS